MPRILVTLSAIGASVAWAVRKLANRSGAASTAHCLDTPSDQRDIWRNAERETIAFRMRSGPGLFM